MLLVTETVVDFLGKPLTVSDHAVKRFAERWRFFSPVDPLPINFLKTLTKLLHNAKLEDMNARGRLKRLLNNRCIQAEYWINSGWRFVIVQKNGQKELTTVERNTF